MANDDNQRLETTEATGVKAFPYEFELNRILRSAQLIGGETGHFATTAVELECRTLSFLLDLPPKLHDRTTLGGAASVP
jgi:hypothetical protein